jgi:K+-sensing histidine kinase KdpD
MDTILAELGEVIDYDGASIQLMREDGLEIVKYKGFLNPANVIGRRFGKNSQTPNAEIIKHSRPLLLPDTKDTYPSFGDNSGGRVRSWLGVPLLFKDKLLGIITIDSRDPHSFTPEQVALAQAFAFQVASAVENANLFEQHKETAQKLLEAETMKSIAETTGHAMHWVANQTAPILYWVQKIRRLAEPIMTGSAIEARTREDFFLGLDIIQENTFLILEVKDGIMGPARKFELVHAHPADLIKTALKNLVLPTPQIEVASEIEPTLPPVWVDRVAIEEVLRNLFVNAIQAMQNVALPRLGISGHLDKSGHFITLRITDNGMGIPPDRIKDIWTPFYTTKAGAGGTGIGLSYCLQVMHKMGGDISVESKVGQGTTFILDLPIYQTPKL